MGTTTTSTEPQAFTNVRLIKKNTNRIVPFRIKHHPGVVLDIVLSTSNENTSAVDGRDRNGVSASMEKDVESLRVTQLHADTSSSDDGAFTLSRASSLPSKGTLSNLNRGLSFSQITTLARKDSIQSKIEQQLVSSLPSDLQARVRASTNVRESLIRAIKDGQIQQANEKFAACLQELDDKMVDIKDMASKITDLVCRNNELAMKNNQMGSKIIEMGSGIMDLASKNNDLASMNNELAYKNNKIANENKDQLAQINQLQKILDAKQDEMKELQIQALNRLALLQTNVQSLLTQTFELHEYPIPRLFIVLPLDTSSWNPLDLLSNKFRLYFLCECGEHTKSINSRIPHHIHLAKHEGYDITHSKEFFQRYGSHVVTVLQMLKYGITVAGVAVPALSHLISPDTVGHVMDSLKSLKNSLEPGVDQVIGYIEKVSADEGFAAVSLSDQMDNKEALEGADLRQLESFLKNKDSNRVLGNLYRTVTTEGHVKWVCIDHYRENYHDKAAKSFKETVASLQGSYDENIGRVEVILYSKVQAEQFYQALVRAKSVYELKIKLDWDTTQHDFKRLRDALAVTNVGVLGLYLKQQDGLTNDILKRNHRYDPILDIMQHPSIQSFTIRGPENFSTRSSISSRNDDFSNLRHLDISLHELKDDILSAKYLIRKASNLSSLSIGTGPLGSSNSHVWETYNELAEHRTYPIKFKEWNICIPQPLKESDHAMATQQSMEHLLKVCCERSQRLNLDGLDELTVDTIGKATTNGSSFTELYLERDNQPSDLFISNVSCIVSRSEMSKITIRMYDDEGRVRILESIQWKHLRHLEIQLNAGTSETSVMRALVDGVTKMSVKVGLDEFVFSSGCSTFVNMPEGDLLQAFVASTSIKELSLLVEMTLEQILLLLRSTDFSRLERLVLWAKGLDSVKVGAILDCLQDAMKLGTLRLLHANILEKQKRRMKLKGISLKREL